MKRILWVFLTVLLFLAALGNYIFSQYRLHDTFDQVREQLILIAANAALTIDVQELLAVPLQQTGDSSPAYQAILGKLEIIKKTNPALKYVYIMSATDQPGILQYVVDADPAPQIITAKCPRAFPGDTYDARDIPEMLKAFSGPTADKIITNDEWGKSISGYAPIYDTSGKSIAILGVDIDAGRIYVLKKNLWRLRLLALIAFSIFFISLLGTVIFRKKGVV
ncbi:MAG: hypothetical protein NT014_05495 [Candidatus Omnitrophica bacterium]|nr:hypothetical protein [Candidatus Omnitrophota bacterium]